MKRLSSLAMLIAVAAIGWFGLQQLQSGGLKGISLPNLAGLMTNNQPPPPRGNDTIRIATFNIQFFGEAKLNDAQVMQTIAATLKNFDLIAIQEVRAVSQDIL